MRECEGKSMRANEFAAFKKAGWRPIAPGLALYHRIPKESANTGLSLALAYRQNSIYLSKAALSESPCRKNWVMKQLLCVCLLIGCGAFSIALSQTGNATSRNESQSHESKITIEGLVRDIACPIQNLEATATHLSMKCLLACARNGSPLVILTKGGDLYLPISDKMPDTDQHQRLLPFLGKYVQASGAVYERNGTRAIVISEITEMKNVPLKIEDE
jgi:hypothetical protein